MTNQQARWLTIREAALALGLSELTVRRRIKDGKLVSRLKDGKYFVNLNAPIEEPLTPDDRRGGGIHPVPSGPRFPPDTSASLPPTRAMNRAATTGIHLAGAVGEYGDQGDDDRVIDDQSSTSNQIDLDALLREHARLAELAGRAAALEEQVRTLETRHASLHEGLVSLSNRNGWLESRLEEREERIKLLTDSRHKQSWWRRLFGATQHAETV